MHKIALISDIHFGCRTNSEKYLKISEDFFMDTLYNTLKDNQITDLRILGDLFDNRNSINTRTMNSVLNVFRFFKNNLPNLKIKCLLGNHDIYYHNRVDINAIECLREFDNVEIVSSVEKEVIEGKSILMVPWITSNTSDIYENFIHHANSKDKIDYLLGHFEIQNFEMVPGIKDENGLQQSKFNNFTRVISGHFHLRDTQGSISYLGCPYQMNWADYGNNKGIHILDVETNELEFIENKQSPKHVKIYVSDIAKVQKDKKKQKALFMSAKNNFVKVIIDNKYKDSAIIKIVTQLETLKPIRLDIDNQYVDDLELSSDADAEIKDLNDPLSFLLEYCKNLELQDIDNIELLKRLKDLYQLSLKEND